MTPDPNPPVPPPKPGFSLQLAFPHPDAGSALAIAAAWADVPASAVLAPGRGSRTTSKARHMAFYLAHVTYGLSQNELARRFGRHRASVAYGCRRIEEAREEGAFDRLMSRLEDEARRVAGRGCRSGQSR